MLQQDCAELMQSAQRFEEASWSFGQLCYEMGKFRAEFDRSGARESSLDRNLMLCDQVRHRFRAVIDGVSHFIWELQETASIWDFFRDNKPGYIQNMERIQIRIYELLPQTMELSREIQAASCEVKMLREGIQTQWLGVGANEILDRLRRELDRQHQLLERIREEIFKAEGYLIRLENSGEQGALPRFEG